MKCKQCKADSGQRKFCCAQCKTTWHNHNRTLTPNAIYDCEICGRHVEKWVSPARVRDGIATNRFCSRTCAGRWRRGENHPLWNGGRIVDRDGYIMVHRPDHPNADRRGYVFEHRLVMELKIGRHLERGEVVHHENGDTADNRPSNLRLFASHGEHKAHELRGVRRTDRGQFKKGVKHASGK